MSDNRLPKSRKLLKAAEYDRVFQGRRSRSDGALVLYAIENGLEYSRLGLVVSRKVGGAVVRNRWKRCLREAFRRSQHDLPSGLDMVALPRAGATPGLSQLEASLRTLSAALRRTPKRGAPRSTPRASS